MALAFKPTIYIPLCKLNMKPRSQNDFPACIFLFLWTLSLACRETRERKSWKQCGRRRGRNYCYSLISWHFKHFFFWLTLHKHSGKACWCFSSQRRAQVCRTGEETLSRRLNKCITFLAHLQFARFISKANRLIKKCREKLIAAFFYSAEPVCKNTWGEKPEMDWTVICWRSTAEKGQVHYWEMKELDSDGGFLKSACEETSSGN